ncbi:MAG: hypothetical protein RIC56_19965 [Pseudomonadales bacterium]
MKTPAVFVFSLLLPGAVALAGDDTVRAAVGGGVGGAVGAAIGEELGDRNGAIVGGAIGGAVGAAIATEDRDSGTAHVVRETVRIETSVPGARHPGVHCPPGQAKKGRC